MAIKLASTLRIFALKANEEGEDEENKEEEEEKKIHMPRKSGNPIVNKK